MKNTIKRVYKSKMFSGTHKHGYHYTVVYESGKTRNYYADPCRYYDFETNSIKDGLTDIPASVKAFIETANVSNVTRDGATYSKD
ncbi:MAG: hypothetical protein IIZ23_00140 [Ruminococcus sp.]|nr:hypothetical protein [Ruminococcus sp.]